MFRNTLTLLAGLGGLIFAPGAGATAQSLASADSLPVEAVRFYRPGAAKTLVKTFVEVPYARLAEGSAAGDSLRYQITMRMELYELLKELRSGTLPVAERERRWKLAIMLAKELGADVEPPRRLDAPKVVSVPPAAVDFG